MFFILSFFTCLSFPFLQFSRLHFFFFRTASTLVFYCLSLTFLNNYLILNTILVHSKFCISLYCFFWKMLSLVVFLPIIILIIFFPSLLYCRYYVHYCLVVLQWYLKVPSSTYISMGYT